MLPRPGLCFVLLALILPAPVASVRKSASESDAAAIANSEEQSDAAATGIGLPGAVHDPVFDYLVHQCVEDRANDWLALHKRLSERNPGLSLPPPAGPKRDPGNNEGVPTVLELVTAMVEIMEQKKHRAMTRSAIRNLWSSRVRKWNKRLGELEEDLLSWGFSYHSAEARCKKGMNDKAYACMKDKGIDLSVPVQDSIDLRDLLTHPAGEAMKDRVREWVHALDELLEAHNYDWDANKKECRKDLQSEADAIKSRTMAELSVGNDTGGECVEAEGKMCPEGTLVTTKRRRDLVKGAATATAVVIAGKVIFMPVGGAVGTLIGGPAGAAGGALAGGSLATGLSVGTGYLASRGPMECGCFQRQCIFDAEQGGCRMVVDETEKLKNPFSAAFPMSGTKCVLAYKSEDTCKITECEHWDFEPTVASNVTGTVGAKGPGVYNCLSSNGSPSGSLTLAQKLPNGEANTAEARIKFISTISGA